MRRVRSSLLIVSFLAVCFSAFPLSADTVPSLSGSFSNDYYCPLCFILAAMDGTSPSGAIGDGYITIFPTNGWQGLCNFVDPCFATYGGSFTGYPVSIGIDVLTLPWPSLLTLYGRVTQGGYSGIDIYDPTVPFTYIEESGSFDFVGTWENNFGVDTGWTVVGSLSYDVTILNCKPFFCYYPLYVIDGMFTTTTPEASTLLLFGSALMTAAGALRRKF